MHLTLALALLAAPALAQVEQGPPNAPYAPTFADQTRAPALAATPVRAEVFAEGLENPWGIAPLPDGSFLVTERPGRLRLVTADGQVGPPIAGLPDVTARQQGGLLDVAIGPDFAQDRRVFWTFARGTMIGGVATAAATGLLSPDGSRIEGAQLLWAQAPAIRGSGVHFGGRIVPDGAGHVFITTGDRGMFQDAALLLDPARDLGKVIRLTLAGAEPADNPLRDKLGAGDVWTLGHRNVQGAALDDQGRLWTVEHGPMGGDELNLLAPGANHGWPMVSYGIDYGGAPVGSGQARHDGFVEPIYYWDPVIAPGGIAFHDGTLFQGWQGDLLIGSLNPGGLVRLTLEGDRVTGEERLLPDLGRVRDVQVLGDGSLLLLIDAPDGRIIRVTPG